MNKTHIVVVLDRSGSMDVCKMETITGFDEFVTKQKLEKGEATLTLVQFDDEYEEVYIEKDIQDVQSIKGIYEPRGMTALLDAIGRTIANTSKNLKMKTKKDTPDRILFVIITDGWENASEEYTREQVFDKITEKRKGNWEFIFLGANQDAIATGKELGILVGSSATYTTNNTKQVFNKLSDKCRLYRNMNHADLDRVKTCSVSLFDDSDRQEMVQE